LLLIAASRYEVCVRSDVDDGYGLDLANEPSSLDAVHSSAEPHIHQHHIRPGLRSLLHGPFACRRVPYNGMPQTPDLVRQIFGDEEFILNEQYPGHVH
jgi:hypothetical protein